MPPTVHVIDDDDAFRASVVRLLSAAGYEVDAYASGDEFLARLPDGPGCILLDVRMPGPSGLELQDVVVRTGNPLPIVFLTGHGNVPMSVQAMRAGAEDFLIKPVAAASLLDAISRALARDAAERARRGEFAELQARYARLTAAERRVFALVVEGHLNKQIAYEVGCAERTVKAHRASVMQKMEAGSLADLVRLATVLAIRAPHDRWPGQGGRGPDRAEGLPAPRDR
jgi:FixJ family two-component response regulator